MKYVIKFSKQGYIKFISHLDMIRLFNRAFKKTGLHLEHSQGFNPHPKMTFGQPLSLGHTSIGEIIEIETKDEFEPSEVMERLQNVMPVGIEILSCEYAPEGSKGIAGSITHAEYDITFNTPLVKPEMIKEFLQQKEIITLKKQKKKKEMKEVNIKPMIRKVTIKKGNDKVIMTTTVDCGSASNLNPDLIVKSFLAFAGIDFDPDNVEIQRNYIG